MDRIRIPKSLAGDMVAHARAEAPNECCGILAGKDSAVLQVHHARNVDRSPVKYTVDPNDMARIFQQTEKAGQDVLAFYHSHTFSEAYPSVTDVKLAPPSDLFGYLFVIVSLANSDAPVIRAFTIASGNVEEVPVEIVADSAP